METHPVRAGDDVRREPGGPGSPDTTRLASLASKLPALPRAVVELQRLMVLEDVEFDQIGQALALDPVLAAKILRIANSPFYGLPSRINALRDAVAILGLASVRTLALSLSIAQQFDALQNPRFDRARAWRRSLRSATIVQVLARASRADANAWFIAAVLQDIGQCLLAFVFPDEYPSSRPEDPDDEEIVGREQEHLGIDHAELGAILVAKWNLDPQIGVAIRAHHARDADTDSEMVKAVRLANQLAALDELGRPIEVGAGTWSKLDLASIVEETRREFEAILQITGT